MIKHVKKALSYAVTIACILSMLTACGTASQQSAQPLASYKTEAHENEQGPQNPPAENPVNGFWHDETIPIIDGQSLPRFETQKPVDDVPEDPPEAPNAGYWHADPDIEQTIGYEVVVIETEINGKATFNDRFMNNHDFYEIPHDSSHGNDAIPYDSVLTVAPEDYDGVMGDFGITPEGEKIGREIWELVYSMEPFFQYYDGNSGLIDIAGDPECHVIGAQDAKRNIGYFDYLIYDNKGNLRLAYRLQWERCPDGRSIKYGLLKLGSGNYEDVKYNEWWRWNVSAGGLEKVKKEIKQLAIGVIEE